LPLHQSPLALPAEKPETTGLRSKRGAAAPCAAPDAAVPQMSGAIAGSAPTAATAEAEKSHRMEGDNPKC